MDKEESGCIDTVSSMLEPNNMDSVLETDLNLRLNKCWLEKAKLELGETLENRSVRLKQLEELIVVDKDIPNARRDNAFLLRFLRAKKFDVDKSFRMVKKYYKMKKESPELFCVSPSSDMHDILKMQIQQMLPHRDENGCAVYVFRVQNCDPNKCPVEKVFRSNVLSLEHAIRDPCTQIGGLVVLLDMAGLSLAHAKFLSPHLAKRTVEVIQEAFPMRFRAFHILHEPFYFNAILTILRPFLKEKIRKRIFTHGNDLNSLYTHIPKEILPAEYGGKQCPFDNTKWREQIFYDQPYFLRLETYENDAKKAKKTILPRPPESSNRNSDGIVAKSIKSCDGLTDAYENHFNH